MARIILDEGVDRRLARGLAGHVTTSVVSQRWAGLSDAAVLDRCAGKFDVFITTDQSLRYQQNIAELDFGVVVLIAGTNRLADLLLLLPQIREAIETVGAGETIEVRRPDD